MSSGNKNFYAFAEGMRLSKLAAQELLSFSMRKPLKVYVFVIVALFVCIKSNAQIIKGKPGVADMHANADFMTLTKLPPDTAPQKRVMPEEEDEDEEKRDDHLPIPKSTIIYRDTNSGFPPAGANIAQSPAPSANFAGLVDPLYVIPPDVNGAAGPNHLMITLNSEVRILNKTGTTISTVTLTNFWSSLSPVDPFDPKILYDPYAGRWIVSTADAADSSLSAILIAVSRTNDPTGTWNFYKIDADAANTSWFDYPSMGFNKNWIVVTGNLFSIGGSSFTAGKLWVFNKANLYANGAGTYTLISNGTSGFTMAPAVTYDSTITTEYVIKTWNGSAGAIRLYAITGSIGSEVLNAVAFATSTTTWASSASTTDFAPQQGSADLVNAGDDRMQAVVYRNGYIWGTQTVFLPQSGPTRSSIQWWQLTTAGAIVQHAFIDDATATNFYAFPSISVNSYNDALIGYSSFSLTQYPSSNYSFRSACDALNTMESTYQYKAGLHSYYKTFGGSRNRWGDYTATCVDPSNDNELWTLGEYANTQSSGEDRWSTWWAKVSPSHTNGGAGTWTWTGTSSTSWFNPCNWDKGTLPDILSDVVIPGGTTNNPTITGATANCKTISINTTAGAVLTIDNPNSGFLNVAQ